MVQMFGKHAGEIFSLHILNLKRFFFWFQKKSVISPLI